VVKGLIILFTATLLAVPAQAAPLGGITIITDVPYKSFTALDGTTATIALDVYIPATAPPPGGYPAVVVVHGSFSGGDKSDKAAERKDLARVGYVAFAPNYRLTCNPDTPPNGDIDPHLCGFLYPAQVQDIEDALSWILDPAQVSTYRINPSLLGMFGTSAGGNLSMLMATLDDGHPKPKAVVELSGEYEWWQYPLSPGPDDLHRKAVDYMGCELGSSTECDQAWHDASPYTWVSPGDTPMYVGNGTYEVIPFQTAIDMRDALDAAGVPNFLRLVHGKDHGVGLEPDIVAGCCTTVETEAFHFLDTYLKPSPQADVTLTGTATPDGVSANAPLTYAFTVSNAGPVFAGGVTFTDTLPSGVTFVSASSSKGSCSGSSTITCTLGDLAPLSPVTVSIVVDPQAAGTVTDQGSVTQDASSTDPTPGDHSVTLQTTAVPEVDSDLSVTATAGPTSLFAGKQLTYSVTAANGGPQSADLVTVAGSLPPFIVLVSATGPQGACSVATGGGGVQTVSCPVGTLATGGQANVKVVVQPMVPGPATGSFAVSGNVFDANPANNTVSPSSTVNPAKKTFYSSIPDTGFSPSAIPISLGTSVMWSVPGGDIWGHTATDATGYPTPLFASGLMDPGGFFSYVPYSAGTFTVNDDDTNHTCSLQIAPTTSPSKGTTTTTFAITWATQAAPAGFVYDVQIKRPHQNFADWLLGTTGPGSTFVPDVGTGKYAFRARLVSTAPGGVASQYSPGKSINVS